MTEAKPSDAAPESRELLYGWGRTSPSAALVQHPATRRELLHSFDDEPPRGVLGRGLGRSYGDAALNAGGRVVDTTLLAGIDLDPATGLCTADAGASIDTLIRVLVPRGWFVPVTPGTRYVTVGGAIAADIHGKNHHASGSWCEHVVSMRMLLPSGELVEIGPDRDPELFWATAGGLGLTGLIVDATFRCRPVETSRLLVETIRANDLDEIMDLMRDDPTEYSVAWIDLMASGRQLGRSVLTRGTFARRDELPRNLQDAPYAYNAEIVVSSPPAPLVPPGLVNKYTMRAFSEVWFRKSPKRREGEIQTIPTFFHPLDMIGNWNLGYGHNGFVQWQIALPFAQESVLRMVIERLVADGCMSFVNVLKTFGAQDPGPLSFPTAGWTLACDIPTTVPRLPAVLDELDRIVADAGGRVYLVKDARIRRELLPQMYPRLDEWREVRERVDPDHTLQSDLARRLGL